MEQQTEVTQLLLSWSGGDRSALERLVPLVYRELRRIAASYLRRERSDHTLSPTALVHEAYLRLVQRNIAEFQGRAHFLAIAARLMRQILVDHAERRRAAKRGGGQKVAFEMVSAAAGRQTPFDVIALDRAMHTLATVDQRQSQVVEMRFFGGLTEDEIAEVLGVSIATVKRDWRLARIVLHHQLFEGILDR